MTRLLKANGHRVIVLEPERYAGPLDKSEFETKLFADLSLGGRNLMILRDFNMSFARAFWRILRSKNLAVLEFTHPSGMLICKAIMLVARKRPVVVYSAQNVESMFARETYSIRGESRRRWSLGLSRLISLQERISSRYLADHLITLSESDKTGFADIYGIPRSKITTLPQPVECMTRPESVIRSKIKQEFHIPGNPKIVLFHGYLNHSPNREAVRMIQDYVAPMVGARRQDVKFLLCGTSMPLFEHGNLRSLGFVDDLDRVLSIADIGIVPIEQGAGVRLKVLDYMRAGIPIVSTKKGIEGLEIRNREEALVVEHVNQKFVDAIVSLIDDEAERIRIGQNAWNFAIRNYSPDRIGADLNSLYERLVGDRLRGT